MAKPKKRPRQLEAHSQDQPITDLPLPDDPDGLARLLEKIYQQEATIYKAYDKSVRSDRPESEIIALRRQMHDLAMRRTRVIQKIQDIHFPPAQMPWSMTLKEFFELPIKQPDLFIYPSQSPTSSPYPDDQSTGPAVEMLELPVTQKTLAPRQVEIIKAFDKSAKQFWHKDTVAAWVKRKPGNSKLEADFKLLADEGYLERQKGKGLFRRTDKPFPY